MEKGEGKRAKHLKHSPIIKNSLTKKMKTKHNIIIIIIRKETQVKQWPIQEEKEKK